MVVALRQISRSPRVMHTCLHAYACRIYSLCSGQVLDFEDIRLLVHSGCLICDFCTSGQHFACGFLRIPSRDGHPCRPANTSPYRACNGLREYLPGTIKQVRPAGRTNKKGHGPLKSHVPYERRGRGSLEKLPAKPGFFLLNNISGRNGSRDRKKLNFFNLAHHNLNQSLKACR
jgi:hypothetical protein